MGEIRRYRLLVKPQFERVDVDADNKITRFGNNDDTDFINIWPHKMYEERNVAKLH
jgi:hypothetical protein